MMRFFVFLENTLRLFALTGMAALAVGIAVTLLDILLRHSVNVAVVGTVDLMQWSVITAASWSIPYAFWRKSHVVVDIATLWLPVRTRNRLDTVAALLSALFVGLIGGYALPSALLAHEYGDSSQTLGIPMLWFWLPFLVGMTLSLVACLALTVQPKGRNPRKGYAGAMES